MSSSATGKWFDPASAIKWFFEQRAVWKWTRGVISEDRCDIGRSKTVWETVNERNTNQTREESFQQWFIGESSQPAAGQEAGRGLLSHHWSKERSIGHNAIRTIDRHTGSVRTGSVAPFCLWSLVLVVRCQAHLSCGFHPCLQSYRSCTKRRKAHSKSDTKMKQ